MKLSKVQADSQNSESLFEVVFCQDEFFMPVTKKKKISNPVGISHTVVMGGELNQLKSGGSHSPLGLAFGV